MLNFVLRRSIPHHRECCNGSLELLTSNTPECIISNRIEIPNRMGRRQQQGSPSNPNDNQDVDTITIEMETFHGNAVKWPDWSKRFAAQIQHVQYQLRQDVLKQLIEPAIFEVVGNNPLNGFDQNWAMLNRAYGNVHEMIDRLMNRIIDLPKIANRNADIHRALINNARIILDHLLTIGIGIEQWSLPLAYLIMAKLDTVTVQKWKNGFPTVAKINELLIFMDHEVKLMDPPSSTGRNAYHRKRTQRPPEPLFFCGLCTVFHRLWKCPIFKGMTHEERIKHLEDNNICQSCLVDSHSIDNCTRQGCPRCDKAKHSSLICPRLDPLEIESDKN